MTAEPATEVAMTAAELRCHTEALGLNVAYLAKRWHIGESAVKNFMKGTHRIPARVILDVDAMLDDTEQQLDDLINQGPALATYRNDHEYREALGDDARYNASWHRTLCSRAAAEIPDATITYAVPPGTWKLVDGEMRRVD